MAPPSPLPYITVVIPNYNGKQFLSDCLGSLKRQTFDRFEIILVDNGSTDGSVSYIQREFPDFVRIISNPDNRGFGAAVNQGIRAARGIFILPLNNDTEVDPHCLEALFHGISGNHRIGMCAPQIRLFHQRDRLDSAGLLLYRDGTAKQRGRMEPHGNFSVSEEVLIPSACAALYRKEMLDQIGYFDERFFAYGEDTDLGLRARLQGWRCIYIPTALVYHIYSGTGGAYSPLKAYLIERNRIWLAIKVLPPSFLFWSPLFTLLRYLYQTLGVYTHRGSSARLLQTSSPWTIPYVLLKAYLAALGKLPVMLRERRRISKRRALSSSAFTSLLKKHAISASDVAFQE